MSLRKRIRGRTGVEAVVAYGALAVVLLAGGSAAALEGRNTVTSDDIVNTHVRGPDLAVDSVGEREVRAGSVATADIIDQNLPNSITPLEIQDGQIASSEIVNGSVDQPELEFDSVRPQELAPLVLRTSTATTVDGGTAENGSYATRAATASCAPGERAIGGGLDWLTAGTTEELVMVEGHLVNNATGFEARGGNDSGTSRQFQALVWCLPAP